VNRLQDDGITQTPQDRHVTLATLSEVLTPDFELRFVSDSYGGDSEAFAVMRRTDWDALREDFGPDRVDAAFPPISKLMATSGVPRLSRPDSVVIAAAGIIVSLLAMIVVGLAAMAGAIPSWAAITSAVTVVVLVSVVVRGLHRKSA